jgi:hypothetical protein
MKYIKKFESFLAQAGGRDIVENIRTKATKQMIDIEPEEKTSTNETADALGCTNIATSCFPSLAAVCIEVDI